MAKASKLRVMLSSRSLDRFPLDGGKPLADTRIELQSELEAASLLGMGLLEVWINERAPPSGGRWDSWEVCLQAVRDCDILIAITNGNAGWTQEGQGIGICHAELMTALDTSPSKVRLVQLPNIPPGTGAQRQRNQRFQDYLTAQSLFRGGTVSDVEGLKARVKEAVFDAVLRLTQEGSQTGGRFFTGEALDWTRLSFSARAEKMEASLVSFIRGRGATIMTDQALVTSIGNGEVLTVVHAIPAAITVASAREMVGQPFLTDHKLTKHLSGTRAGPVHVIACQKTATESQAARLLGFADATIVSGPFGVFVEDNVQKVQFVFLTGCRDDTTTRHAAQRFFVWLSQSGEDKNVAERAAGRARIVKAIANESR